MSESNFPNEQPWAQANEANNTTVPGSQGWQQPPAGQSYQTNQGGLIGAPLNNVRQSIEGQISQAIDHYASQVPGGHQFTPEAKRAVSSILDGLQRQLETEASNRLGGANGLGGTIFGNPSNNQGGQNNQGGGSQL